MPYRVNHRECEIRIQKQVTLLKAVNDKYDRLESRSRSAALAWDAERQGLQRDLKRVRAALRSKEKACEAAGGSTWNSLWDYVVPIAILLSIVAFFLQITTGTG